MSMGLVRLRSPKVWLGWTGNWLNLKRLGIEINYGNPERQLENSPRTVLSLNTKPWARNPKPQTRNPKPETQNPKPTPKIQPLIF